MTEQHVKLGLQREPMMQRNAGRIDAMTLSEIVAISEEAARLRASGHDVLAFRTGAPDFPTHMRAPISKRAARA